MKSLKFHITTLSPLLITNNTGDPNMVSTKEYISGTAILGALAGMYIRENNLTDAHKDNSFYKWFLNGSLKFTNAYIVSYDDKNNIKVNHPIPTSIQKDKDNESDIYDLLHYDLNELKNSNGEDITTKRIDGFGKIEDASLYEQKIKKSLNFHHERDSGTGTTKEIFNYESIDAGQKFEGEIIGEDTDLETLCTSFGKSFEINIGRSRSAQYGKVTFEFLKDKPEDIPVNSASGEISLTFLSDTIIYNEQGFSTTDKKDFEATLKDKLRNSVEIKKAFIKTGEIENFVSVWKLRKPSETCFLMGSCFLLSGISTNEDKKLKELQINGIGERTHEGFGRMAIEIQTNKNKFTKRDYSEAQINSGTIPSITKEIAKEAVKKYIQRTIEVKALEECAGFAEHKKLPTKSLISRLEMAVKTRDKNNITKYLINNKTDFTQYLKELRSTATDKLSKCHNGNDTLLEFLQKKEIKIDENIMKDDIQTICNKIAFTPANDIDFINSVYKSYFETFFSAMRKAKKMEKEV